MYYSLLIEYSFNNGRITTSREIYWLDVEVLETIIDRIVIPYLKDEQFWVDGVELNRSHINRIRIVSHKETIQELIRRKQEKFQSRDSFVRTIYSVKPRDIINDTHYVNNITDDVLQDVRKELNSISNSCQQETKQSNKMPSTVNNNVFIVHGRDNATKTEVARFLEQLSLKAVILHEQVSQGKTIIEKIEEYTDVGYGIILYTPCDKGCLADDSDMKPRARQNVVFEHGYLIGKLGRDKVCALMKGDVEYPNDISGVLYVKYQDDWKLQLAKEMKKAGLPVDMNLLI